MKNMISKYEGLPDSEFGIPEEKKFPLDSKAHVISAMKLFGHAKESKKKELARRIATKAKEYGVELMPEVQKYLKKESSSLNESQIGELIVIDPTDDLQELEYWYERFNQLPNRLRILSDDECIRLYGKTNMEMYLDLKLQLTIDTEREKDEDDFELPDNEFGNNQMTTYMDDIKEETDMITRLKHKINTFNTASIVESAITDDLIDDLPDAPDGGIEANVPVTVPYFSPEEIESLVDDTDNEFLAKYKNSCPSGLIDFDYKEVFDDIQDIYKEYQETKDEELATKMIRLGWNPSVEPTSGNMVIARKRIKKYIKENYNVRIVDISNMTVHESNSLKGNKDAYPVYIVLSFTNTRIGKVIHAYQGANYSHSGIALDSSLSEIYTYNAATSGLNIESIKGYLGVWDQARIKVMCVFLNKKMHDVLKKNLQYFVDHREQTKYNYLGYVDIVFHHKREARDGGLNMICSQFVDVILKLCNVDITGGTASNLVTPDTFDKVQNPYVYIVYQGLIKDFKKKDLDKKIKALGTKDAIYKKELPVAEACDYLFKFNDILLYKMISIKESKCEETMHSLRECLNVHLALEEVQYYQNDKSTFHLIDMRSENAVYIREATEDNNVFPVYIVLSYTDSTLGKITNAVTHANYSHASISLDNTMTKLYTFSSTENKMTIENIQQYRNVNEEARMEVLCLFVNAKQFKQLSKNIKYFVDRIDQTSYRYQGLFDVFFNHKRNTDDHSLKMICSQFVDTILKMSNIDITGGTSSNMVSPGSFEHTTNPYVYVVYEGLIRDFKQSVLDKKIKRLITKDVLYRSTEEAVDLLQEFKFPIHRTKYGYKFDLPKSYERQYQESHRLLGEYERAKNYEGMKEELAKLWSVNIGIERMLNAKHFPESKRKKLLDLRARVLNDFRKYLQLVMEVEPNFNFNEYYKNSPYYDGSVEVDDDILRFQM